MQVEIRPFFMFFHQPPAGPGAAPAPAVAAGTVAAAGLGGPGRGGEKYYDTPSRYV